MNISWGIFCLFLWVYRCLYSVLGQVVVTRFTSLGDATSFQVASAASLGSTHFELLDPLGGTRVLATEITRNIGTIFFRLSAGEPILINIGFQTIAFVGLVKFLSAVEGRVRVVLAVLVMLPSFSLWSSVAGKEAIVVGAVGFISAYLVGLYEGKNRLGVMTVVSFAIVFVFKNHFIPAIAFILLSLIVARRVQQKSFVVLAGGLLSLLPLYIFREKIGEIALVIPRHFISFGSSRSAFWSNIDDVFLKAPEGMFQSFFGPTLAEASSGPLQLLSYIESAFIIVLLIVLAIHQLGRTPVFSTLLAGFSLFWILFATYPFGVMNAGSAIRYRTGYELLVFVVVVVLMSRSAYIAWKDRVPGRSIKLSTLSR